MYNTQNETKLSIKLYLSTSKVLYDVVTYVFSKTPYLGSFVAKFG